MFLKPARHVGFSFVFFDQELKIKHYIPLTHFSPVAHFYTPWKGVIEMWDVRLD